MRIIALITHSADIHQIVEHIGVETAPPNITPTHEPPMWDGADAQAGEGVAPAQDLDESAQPAPRFEVDQFVSWWVELVRDGDSGFANATGSITP